MSADGDSPREYFRSRGFDVRVEERNLHAEYMAANQPGLASFFVENRTYYCVDLLRGGSRVAKQYTQGETEEEALARAQRRYASEQV